ncbi:cytochrome PufQ [Aestuariicoccus sp. MJ-SS9]|uniref:cytochrome PufQ n=1 Tax=Aestuariicoccus sp. MJ-SS9 TaxID=3079855 RepID=UPI002907B88B|nr:cytochrome PufQ [Aestuariicoccus sp. MJ-SS9]MDU8910940.1 cytochrome PufQ [Aestuariicoccus sp. MJ-SS9]
MTDFTSNDPRPRHHAKRGMEFTVYFSIIFALAIPFAMVGWMLDVFQKQTLMLHGPLARAWAEADRITPLIFSA